MDKRTKDLRAQGRALDPIIHIGKSGLADGVVEQVGKELEKHPLIKLRILKAALPDEETRAGRTDMVEELARRTGSQVIDRVGNVVVLYRQ